MKLKLVTIFVAVLLSTQNFAQKNMPKTSNLQLTKSAGKPRSTLMNINNISMWIRVDGWSARDPRTGNSGVIFPNGISNLLGVIFQDGIVWAGIVKGGSSPELRAGRQTYNIGTVEGRIISKGVAKDPNDPDVRIWRIRRDWQTTDRRRDIAELNHIPVEEVFPEQIATVCQQYEMDWHEWPWEKGTPFYDLNGNGVMDSGKVPGHVMGIQTVLTPGQCHLQTLPVDLQRHRYYTGHGAHRQHVHWTILRLGFGNLRG